MNNGKQKGLVTELECELAFARLGFAVLKPICDNYRYDYVVDLGNKFIRIQCKTSQIERNESYLIFSAISSHVKTHKNTSVIYTKDQIDYFYTCYNHISYLIPIEEGIKSYTLRLKLPLNNNQHGIRFAEDYELQKILLKYEGLETNLIENTIYSSNKHKNNFCKICNEPIGKEATYCVCCANQIQAQKSKINLTTREKLKKEIRTLSFVQAGKIYNVSDNTIRKWCEKFNLPSTKKEINSYSDEEWDKI